MARDTRDFYNPLCSTGACSPETISPDSSPLTPLLFSCISFARRERKGKSQRRIGTPPLKQCLFADQMKITELPFWGVPPSLPPKCVCVVELIPYKGKNLAVNCPLGLLSPPLSPFRWLWRGSSGCGRSVPPLSGLLLFSRVLPGDLPLRRREENERAAK